MPLCPVAMAWRGFTLAASYTCATTRDGRQERVNIQKRMRYETQGSNRQRGPPGCLERGARHPYRRAVAPACCTQGLQEHE